ncbi:MAG TPA: DUF362 domain-containing protein [Thermoanaerobaculia bacterium]
MREERVAIASDRSLDKSGLLVEAVEGAGLWEILARRCSETGRAAAALSIVIKPDFTLFHRLSPTATDPELVERLIDEFHDRGFHSAVLANTVDSFVFWLANRDVLSLADLAGYRFVTPKERAYDVLDLADDLVGVEVPPGSVLEGALISRVWRDADVRIAFGANKTDEEDLFAVNLQNLVAVLPLRDKFYHYRQRLDLADVATELVSTYPVHFAIVDAVISNHGSAGTRALGPIETHTVIAGTDLLLTETVAAKKMGVDPAASRVLAAALERIGLPQRSVIIGDMTPYPRWRNVHPFVSASVRRRNLWPEASWMLAPLLQSVDRELFPFHDVTADRANALLVRLAGQPDADPLAFWLCVAGNALVATGGHALQSWRIMASKDALHWREAPLGIDPFAYSRTEYLRVPDEVVSLRSLLRDVPAVEGELRWTYLDDAVVFEVSRLIPVPFEHFVARLDVSRGIQYMNDYIGGRAIVVERDARGRPMLQAERNLYLPQPNYLALSQGKPIDVTKLEVVEYLESRHALYWKTILSTNGSARYDDGMVELERTADGETRATIFGRQEFTLPPLWNLINHEANASLKRYLVTQAYTTFFARTFANFEAVVEGREVRIGKQWDPLRGEEGGEPPPSLAAVGEMLTRIAGVLPPDFATAARRILGGGVSSVAEGGILDEDGFMHFNAAVQPVQTERKGVSNGALVFIADLVRAVQQDLAAMASPQP